MSILNSQAVQAAMISFDTRFNAALVELQKVDKFWMNLATVVPSSTRISQHNWLGVLPAFKEWVGERNIGKLNNTSYQIQNRKWANGVEVDVDDIEDDALGMYMPKIDMLAEMSWQHRVQLLVDYLANGFATTAPYGACYDGTAMFNANHPNTDGVPGGPAAQSNYLANKPSVNTYDKMKEMMLELQDNNGQPLNLDGSVWIVGPKYRATGRQVLLAERLANGASNTDYGTAELYVSQKLVGAYADMHFLCDLKHAIKPLIFQMRREVQFRTTRMVPGGQSKEEFMTDKVFFGADGRYNVGFGLWQMAIGSDGTQAAL